MADSAPPSTMRAWQYRATTGGLEKNLKLADSVALPKPKSDQYLVKVIAAALNPVDYKPAELPIVGGLLVSNPATPGIDFAGRIVKAADGSSLKPGQLVFGCAGNTPVAGGALAEFAVAKFQSAAAIPEGLSPIDAATIGVAGITAYQSIVPRVKAGNKVFINGGSGGTGVYGIQIAKALGCHVTTTCSTANIDLCKSLGADDVIDYRKENVIEALKNSPHRFDHAVDNVGEKELSWRSTEFMATGAAYIIVGGEPNLDLIMDTLKRKIIPAFLGGIKGKVEVFLPSTNPEDLGKIARLIVEGKVKVIVDQKFDFEDVPLAFEKLKTHRAKGKIIIDVASDKGLS